ncbi:MAG TPA: BON domain-containing protein [Nitrosospira sp.]|nr:BON domain-containing protein [Nitrosospira sp.]
MKGRNRSVIAAMALAVFAGAISIPGCTRHEDKVHESWVTPPEKEAVDDTMLVSALREALRSDPDVKNLDIRIEAHNGEVMLSGIADNQAQIDRVAMLAWMMEGIKKVDNKMGLRNASAATQN